MPLLSDAVEMARYALSRPRTGVSVLRSRFSRSRRPRRFHIDGFDVRIAPGSVAPQTLELFVRRALAGGGQDLTRILDVGANAGLASLFLSRAHPEAQIDAIECDPELFEVLSGNLARNAAGNVAAHHFAAGTADGEARFSQDGHGGGRLSQTGETRVPVRDLASWLDERPGYDMVKMDIEGAELEVLPRILPRLTQVRLLVFEYHAPRGEPSRLGPLLCALEDAGFAYRIDTEDDPKRSPRHAAFSNRLVIRAQRRRP